MRKEEYKYQGLTFQIKTIMEENVLENLDLIVVIKYKHRLLEFYHAHHETVVDFNVQNRIELEDKLYEIAKTEIKSKFFDLVYGNY